MVVVCVHSWVWVHSLCVLYQLSCTMMLLLSVFSGPNLVLVTGKLSIGMAATTAPRLRSKDLIYPHACSIVFFAWPPACLLICLFTRLLGKHTPCTQRCVHQPSAASPHVCMCVYCVGMCVCWSSLQWHTAASAIATLGCSLLNVMKLRLTAVPVAPGRFMVVCVVLAVQT